MPGAVAQAGVVGGQLLERRNTELARADFEGMKALTAESRNEFIRSMRTTDLDYNGINDAWGATAETLVGEGNSYKGSAENQRKILELLDSDKSIGIPVDSTGKPLEGPRGYEWKMDGGDLKQLKV